MPTTDIDKVYYPDQDTVDQPNVWAATMAGSIEQGIGARLRQQEVAVGLKAGIQPGTRIPNSETAIAPFIIRSENGGFNQGFNLSGGVATVTVKGLYMVAASVGINPSILTPGNAGRTVSLTLQKGTSQLAGSEVLAVANFYQNAAATTVISCVPGDTISVLWKSAGNPDPATMAASSVLNYLSIALIQPLPA